MKRPNVIVFFTDQQRFDTTGVHGNPMGLTPNFDRMAKEGTHFFHTFSPQPVCLPCRAVLQTGRYASQLGIYNNGGGLEAETETLGSRFKKAGYSTAYIGKWHIWKSSTHGSDDRVPPEYRRGYDYWLGANTVELHTDAYYSTLFDSEGNEVFLPGYRADAYADAAIRYVHERKDSEDPFFLFLSFLEPHFQNTRDDFPAPTGYEEHYVDAWTPPDLKSLVGTAPRHLPGYYGMVKRLDEALGRLQDALRSMNLLEDTIIVFTTDHGCHFKTRNSEYKRSCHDSSIRIPMAISGPGFNGGRQVKEPVSLIDLPPTLLDACSIPVPEAMQGYSMLPLVRQKAQDWPEEAYVEVFNDGWIERCVRTRRWLYGIRRVTKGCDPADGWEFQAAYLFDQKADPWQLENLVGVKQYTDVEAVLNKRLVGRMTAAGEPAPVQILPAIEKSIAQRCRLSESEKFQ
jgi:arylsulfatase A-like enzyme